ncbi:putative metal-dependent hydrolase [Cohnella cholangitidis]|uniref:Putative metal-dependent hydrolase FPL14_28535 n=2 Tax=Cohnella cholangitidis TaxID=2598458 RepID=A0A7G5C646_9BACL|nr:putative metal-dependent hydrolase [Cohnella cholangitidis]
MSDSSDRWSKWAMEEVWLADANPRWLAAGESLIESLEARLLSFGVCDFEHIGSTAIPGLPAKPIIDIMAQATTFDRLHEISEALSSEGWNNVPPELDLRPYRRFWVKTDKERRVAHLHLFLIGEPRYAEQLAFRDALLDRRDWAMAYGQLKVELAERYRRDREAYSEAKADFIEKILLERKVKVTKSMNQDLRFPIGRFNAEGEVSARQRLDWIDEMANLPIKLAAAIEGLNGAQLDTPYRPDGWTVRQVVHHLADSHLNSFTRFKLALTEDQPAIKPYYEERWAQLADTVQAPVETSIALIAALHERWVILLRSLTDEDFSRTFYHPESKQVFRLDHVLGTYAWHGRHHVAHITSLRRRMGW